MKNKTKVIIGIIVLLVVVIGTITIVLYGNSSSKNIPDDYIAVFHGGVGEETYETYIYKIDNGQANYGFKYVNAICHTKSWGSDEVECNVDSKGSFDWTDGAFSAAKKHNAYDYVTDRSGNKYTIEEFMMRFLMD